MEKRYEAIEHTADFGIRAYGDSLSDLFTNAAVGMFSSIADLTTVDPIHKRDISVTETDREALLVEWLRELLYLFSTDGIILSRFDIGHMTERSLKARVYGERYKQEKHTLHTEIKAVTYHGLEVIQAKGGWKAQIIFDA
ncbi:MAG: archease [Candidatus Omnitrophica bacterium]|nr:archease [Candidatus Omnitrophota bacterium]